MNTEKNIIEKVKSKGTRIKFNYKRLISMCLIISILFNTLICPISFAVMYEFGQTLSAHRINWKNLSTNYTYSETEYVYGYEKVTTYKCITAQTVDIKVNKSGIYNVKNLFGGGISSNFVISGCDGNLLGLSPLPVATYGKDGASTLDLSKYNNSGAKSVSVYLEADKVYCVSFVSNEGSKLPKNFTDSPWATVYVEYIPQNSEDMVYETEISSMDYTAPNVTLLNEYDISVSANGRGGFRTW